MCTRQPPVSSYQPCLSDATRMCLRLSKPPLQHELTVTANIDLAQNSSSNVVQLVKRADSTNTPTSDGAVTTGTAIFFGLAGLLATVAFGALCYYLYSRHRASQTTSVPQYSSQNRGGGSSYRSNKQGSTNQQTPSVKRSNPLGKKSQSQAGLFVASHDSLHQHHSSPAVMLSHPKSSRQVPIEIVTAPGRSMKNQQPNHLIRTGSKRVAAEPFKKHDKIYKSSHSIDAADVTGAQKQIQVQPARNDVRSDFQHTNNNVPSGFYASMPASQPASQVRGSHTMPIEQLRTPLGHNPPMCSAFNPIATNASSSTSSGVLVNPANVTATQGPPSAPNKTKTQNSQTATMTKGAITMNTLITPGRRVVAVPGYLKLPSSCYTEMKRIGDGGEGAIWKAYITDDTIKDSPDTPASEKCGDLGTRIQNFEREVVTIEDKNTKRHDESVIIVAVKVTKMTDNQAVYPGEVQDKFYQELSILATLQNHPNIVELVGYCDEGVLAILMKMYYANLKSLLYATGEFDTLPVFDFSQDLANALCEMHNNGIIHCDLKSPNLLVDHDGNRLKLVVTDFGVSQVESAFDQVRNRINVVVDAASFSYASPEVLESFFNDSGAKKNNSDNNRTGTTVALYREADPSRDIYAAAVIIWEMLAKELCYVDSSATQIYHQVVTLNTRPPIPFDWQSPLVSKNMYAAWRRYEGKWGTAAVEALARLVQICWSSEAERRLNATVLFEWISDIRKLHGV